MKTVQQHFTRLPRYIANRAIKNSSPEQLTKRYIFAKEALCRAFIWSSTSEGFKFWHQVSKQLDKPVFVKWPKLPKKNRKLNLVKLRQQARAYNKLLNATPSYRELFVKQYKLVCYTYGIFNFLARVNLDGLRSHFEFQIITGRLTRKDLRAICTASHGAFALPTPPKSLSL